ncbi:MAG: FAD:protein FMN transferase [Verrucomicrobia bacterium]|nr:FAD:protein FMN transferase [Verrucomicrobiota bacterium]
MKITWPFNFATFLPGLLFVSGCSTPATHSLQRFEFTQPQMGSLFSITLYAPDKVTADQAAKAAFDRVAELNRIMSDYDPQSELMQLCRKPSGLPVRVSDDLFDILQQSQKFSRLSNGAFDVTVGPYVRVWRSARKRKALPSPETISALTGSIGYQKIRLDPHAKTVTLLAAGMQLDLGGIAKGYAADKALAVLRHHGITRAMAAASGDIAVGDPPPGRQGWTIGIASIDSSASGLTQAVLLKNAAVSTSGDTEQFVEIGGVRYSHIVDPATGRGLTERIGVTIIARNAMTTDALATAVSVMGAERGLRLIDSLSDVSGLIVTLDDDGKHFLESHRFKQVRKVHLPKDTPRPASK